MSAASQSKTHFGLNELAALAAIIGLFLTLVIVLLTCLTVPEIHDWAFHTLLKHWATPQKNIARTPTILPPAQPVESPAKPVEKYFDEDPVTHQPFEKIISFDKFDHVNPNKVRGGDSNTPGREVRISWTAPGPVTSVSGHCLVGWCVIESCSADGNTANCEGWTNDGNHGTINMDVKWSELRPVAGP